MLLLMQDINLGSNCTRRVLSLVRANNATCCSCTSTNYVFAEQRNVEVLMAVACSLNDYFPWVRNKRIEALRVVPSRLHETLFDVM